MRLRIEIGMFLVILGAIISPESARRMFTLPGILTFVGVQLVAGVLAIVIIVIGLFAYIAIESRQDRRE